MMGSTRRCSFGVEGIDHIELAGNMIYLSGNSWNVRVVKTLN
jgi:hypothetical protein